MDPNAWQAYHQAAAAYSNRFSSSSNQDDHPPAYHNPLSLLAASQHYQHNSLLPPSLLAAQQHKSQAQQALANHLLTPPVTPVSTAWDQTRRSVIEAKTSQPAFPGQPPPLQDARRIESSSPAFPGQPPPRQSSQPRSQVFPGSSNHYSQQESPGYGNNYSPGAPSPSPQSYNNVQSPQENYHSHSNQRREERERQQRELERQRIEADIRERQKEKERQEQRRIAEERREQERIRQEQEFRREQERIRQEKEREERVRKEQEERKRREREKLEQERIRREQEKIRQEHEKRKREEEEKRRREEERRREQERIRQEQERIRQEQERIAHERKMQEERDLGLARLSAMGALNDLGEESNGYNNQHYDQHQEQSNNFNINMFNQYQQNMIKQEHEQKPLVNQFNNWINRANELLDLSSSDSRDTNTNNDSEQSSNNFIPQILMNPWDPQQPPMMTFAPIANAMQQYQQQWLSQYHQAAGMLNNDEGSFPLGRFKVLCIAPDEDMGFLINLPPPCNLLFQQEALVSKKVDSPFIMTFQKFLKDPDLSNVRKNLTEAPDRPPPYIEPEEPKIKQEIKREYVPPYTPKATHDPDSKAKLSSSGFSRSLEITPVRRNTSSRSHQSSSRASMSVSRPSSSSSSNSHSVSSSSSSRPKQVKRNVSDDEDEIPEIPPELLRRETSRRKAKENLKSKLEAQEKLLMDQDDPTFNNPALDLDDSDDDAEWNPLKDAEKSGNKRKRGGGGDSSDEEDDEDYSEFNSIHGINNKSKVKKRAYDNTGHRKMSTNSDSNDTHVPEGEDFKVGTFLILKSDENNTRPALWRVDGKTLIQKYECINGQANKYKCVNTYSGWTQNTKHRYKAVEVKACKSAGDEAMVEWVKDAAPAKETTAPVTNGKSPAKSEPQKKEETLSSKPTFKKKVNNEEIRTKSRKETAQFQENFEVYMQTLISQCLDSNFLNEIFSEADDYFVSNIERVDSVTLLRKDKLLTGTVWTIRFQKALATWPCLNNLGSESCASTVCGACEKARAKTMLQLFGQPYNNNTLSSLPPDQEAMMNRNFSVCEDCSELCNLYHNLHHQKQKLYVMCSEIVEKRKTSCPGIDTTQILNQLLADDSWLETQFKRMQDLWADADCFV